MKKIDLGQTIAIVANLGVIAGIVFLGYELNQNNQFLAAEARYALLQNQVSMMETIATNPDLARLLYEPLNSVPLTELERARRRDLVISLLRRWEWEHERFTQGVTDLPPTETFRARYRQNYLELDWPDLKPRFSPAFAEWMDENVVNW